MRRACGVSWLPFARLYGNFLARTTILRNSTPDAAYSPLSCFARMVFDLRRMELPTLVGIFRVAKSSGEGRMRDAPGPAACEVLSLLVKAGLQLHIYPPGTT